jgi:hypothetical protein
MHAASVLEVGAEGLESAAAEFSDARHRPTTAFLRRPASRAVRRDGNRVQGLSSQRFSVRPRSMRDPVLVPVCWQG